MKVKSIADGSLVPGPDAGGVPGPGAEGVPGTDAESTFDSTVNSGSPSVAEPSISGANGTSETVTLSGSGMVFINTYGSQVSSAFRTAIITAENFFQSHFNNQVTLNMSFDLGSLGSQFSGQNHFDPVRNVTYTNFVKALSSHATTQDDLAAVKSLPSADPSGGAGFAIPIGMARILGLAGSGSDIDDTIVLNSDFTWQYGADAVGVLEHEISEGALGRIGGLGIQNTFWAPMDLFRYSAVNQRDYSGGRDGLASFFSVDGSVMLTPLHNAVAASGTFDGQDLADWASGIIGDAFGPGGPGSPGTVSATDLRVMDILGWTPAAAQQANFTIADLTTSATVTLPGDPYAGPVSGLEHQYVNITPDNLNIASLTPNAFIHSGFGTDGINVSQANGNNILDGSAGSNFLIGGTGTDTFYMDDREPTSPVFSTIVNFHAGDNATVWGVNASDFKLVTLENQGAAGALGLDFVFTKPGHLDTSFVLAGYTGADLTNGRLTASYGTTPNLSGLPGSAYLAIHAN
jgi:hypothetical protein